MNFINDIKNKLEKDEVVDIVYYGPSTTSFEYVFPNWGEIIKYVLKAELLKEKTKGKEKVHWNIHTINLGFHGAASGDLLKRFQEFASERKPKPYLLFLNIGKNDVRVGVVKEVIAENIRKMIQQALGNNIKIIFTTSVPTLFPEGNKKLEEYIENEKKIAKEFNGNKNFLFVDLWDLFPQELLEKSYTLIEPYGIEALELKPGDLDYVHYNKLGNALVAKILLKEVFNINFDEKKFLKDLSDNTKKYPGY